MRTVAAILLAAGGSSRLGRPKQLVKVDGETLVRRTARALLGAGPVRCVVVCGAAGDRVAGEVADLEVGVVQCADWACGMATSIQRGLDAVLQDAPSPTALLLAVSDQPGVGVSTYRRIIEAHTGDGEDLVACRYGDAVGVPALFGSAYYPELRTIRGDLGCRAVLNAHAHRVRAIACPEAELDIDTEGDVARMRAGR